MKKLFYQLAAAITFFTRIPLWRIVDIPAESFKKVICFWPLTGWITGGITAGAWLGFSRVFPPILAIIITLVVRILLTGGFHEDGLGDFFDGFGGGKTKADILRIMKDSHVGSYALIGVMMYYLLLINTVISLPKEIIFPAILAADPLSKLLTTIMMNFLPYARTESESKSKTLYDKLSVGRFLAACLFGLLPLLLLLNQALWLSILIPIGLALFMFFLYRRYLRGNSLAL
jgi:adenosylcobinamide-GDP ribazoletransferase